MTRTIRSRTRRAFSLVELLIAISISSTLLAACVAALDASFKSYQATTESAAINVSTRLTMHRLTSLIRNGDDFGPYPVNPIATPQIVTDNIEFIANTGPTTRQFWTIQQVADATDLGPFRLDARVETLELNQATGAWTSTAVFNQTLLYQIRQASFTLEYDVGPRLRRATIDLTVGPDGARGAQHASTADIGVATDLSTPLIRMVSSVRPRRLTE